MNKKIVTVAVDVMGAQPPDVIFRGLSSASVENSALRFRLYGPKNILAPILRSYSTLSQVSTLCHASLAISMDDKVGVAVRKRKNTSMWQAICACRDGEADAVVSGGNTAVLVAFSRFGLGLLAGFSHPVLMAAIKKLKMKEDTKTLLGDDLYAMDVGGHYEASHDQLIKMAYMGSSYLHTIHRCSIDVGILNMATEEKGPKSVLTAHSFLQDFPSKNMCYRGLVEPSVISSMGHLRAPTLIVTDGFSGNIFVKSLEQMVHMFRDVMAMAPFWKRLVFGFKMHKSLDGMLLALVNGVRGFVFKVRESSREETYKRVALQCYYADRKDLAKIAAQATETNEMIKEFFKNSPSKEEETWSSTKESAQEDALCEQPSL